MALLDKTSKARVSSAKEFSGTVEKAHEHKFLHILNVILDEDYSEANSFGPSSGTVRRLLEEPHLPSYLRQSFFFVLSDCLCQARRLKSLWEFSYLHLPSLLVSSAVTGVCCCTFLYMGYECLNWDYHASTESALYIKTPSRLKEWLVLMFRIEWHIFKDNSSIRIIDTCLCFTFP